MLETRHVSNMFQRFPVSNHRLFPFKSEIRVTPHGPRPPQLLCFSAMWSPWRSMLRRRPRARLRHLAAMVPAAPAGGGWALGAGLALGTLVAAKAQAIFFGWKWDGDPVGNIEKMTWKISAFSKVNEQVANWKITIFNR